MKNEVNLRPAYDILIAEQLRQGHSDEYIRLKTGYSRQYVANIERGTQYISLAYISKLSQVLHYEVKVNVIAKNRIRRFFNLFR